MSTKNDLYGSCQYTFKAAASKLKKPCKHCGRTINLATCCASFKEIGLWGVTAAGHVHAKCVRAHAIEAYA